MRFLFTFLLICIYAVSTAQIPSYVPTNGLVGWWPFNGNANDESGNGNNGTVNGATLTSDRFGNLGKAYNFDGTSNFIEIPYNISLTPNTGTVALWVKVNGTFNSEQQLFYGQNTGRPAMFANSSFRCGVLKTAGLSWKTQNSTIDYAVVCGNTQLDNGSWQLIVGTYTPTSLSLYKNGILEVIINTSLIQNQSVFNNFFIGGFGPSASSFQFFNGIIDDIAIYNRALSQQEITQLYNGIVTTTTPEDTTSNVGIGTTNPKRKLHVNDVMRLEPRDTAPSNPAKGDIYFDGVLNKLRVFDGSVWQNCW